MTEAAEADPGWCEGHAAAMRTAYQRFPDDLDVAALFAESLMNVTPWQMWDLPTGEPADGAHTARVPRGARARPRNTRGAACTPASCTCTST